MKQFLVTSGFSKVFFYGFVGFSTVFCKVLVRVLQCLLLLFVNHLLVLNYFGDFSISDFSSLPRLKHQTIKENYYIHIYIYIWFLFPIFLCLHSFWRKSTNSCQPKGGFGASRRHPAADDFDEAEAGADVKVAFFFFVCVLLDMRLLKKASQDFLKHIFCSGFGVFFVLG